MPHHDETPLILLPVGSLEAHGPHLPPETDTIIAHELARRIAQRYMRETGSMAIVAPPVRESVCGFADGFPGTQSVAPEHSAKLLRDAVRDAREILQAPVAFVNLHFDPDHLVVLREVAAAEGVRLVDFTTRAHVQRIGGEFATGSCHGGRFETSLMLAAEPEMVDPSYKRLAPNPVDLPGAIRAGKRSFRDVGMPQAYCGWPGLASLEEGGKTYDVLVDLFLAELETGPPVATGPKT